jgi:hypothetical protein
MKAKLLRKAGEIEEAAEVKVVAPAGENARRAPTDAGGASATPAPVYAVTDDDGHGAEVHTRDFKIVP